MLFTVHETAFILDVKPAHVYYLFSMSKVDGVTQAELKRILGKGDVC